MSQLDPATDAPGAAALCDGYPFVADAYNEMCTGPGAVRPHWSYLARSLDTLGVTELRRRLADARRLIRDNDVTYNIYGDPRGMGRPWELDVIPLLIESEEWSRTEAGLIQRAELLNLLLADLYGERTVISKGILPPELVFSHPGFLHPCDGMRRADQRYLDIYAVDLARAADGRLWVIGDRTQAPSGAGYALENRVVLSRVLPSLFRDSHVHRLAGFFRSLRARLSSLGSANRGDPRVVVLTPGPDNETYFEHAYLANYLGYTLVQGTDLQARSDGLWLKTLDALERVDVILRRVDDEYCDPLELRDDSFLGVPGLVHAVRTGQVSVANPLGSGILQNPALMAFLPDLAQHFLGQDLRLPMPQAWWCGAPAAREHVLAHLDSLVVKPMRPQPGQRSVFVGELEAPEQAALRDQIIARPHQFIAQEVVPLSRAPVFADGGQLESRQLVLRSFLVAEEDSYKVMPGGLTRVSAAATGRLVSSQYGGVSKDTWVVASEPEKHELLLQPPVWMRSVPYTEGEVPSRVAEDLFWVGRYAERVEATARLLRVIHYHLADQFMMTGVGEEHYSTQHLLYAITHQTTTYPGFVGAGAEERLAAPEPELLSIISDDGRPGSLAQSLKAFLRAARSARDRLSGDTWGLINEIDREYQRLLRGSITQLGDVLDELDTLIGALVGFSGLASENMMHGQGYRFLQIGRRLERALHTTTLLRTALVPVADGVQEAILLEAILSTTDSLMTYRRRYRGGVQVPAVLELLVQDESNPRAIGYQLSRMSEHIGQLPGERAHVQRTPEERVVLQCLTEVRLADPLALSTPSEPPQSRAQLGHMLLRLTENLPLLADAVATAYFRREEQLHQLVRIRPGGGGV